MPHTSSRPSPRKPLGENTGNPIMLPPSSSQTSQYFRERDSNQGRSQSQAECPKKSSEEALPPGRRTRSSKYLKGLLDREKSKPGKETGELERARGHKKSKSTSTSYSVFPRPNSIHSEQSVKGNDVVDKENQQTPIWAQFASTAVTEKSGTTKVPLNDQFDAEHEVSRYTPQSYSPSKQTVYPANDQPTLSRRPQPKPRPKSECLTGSGSQSSFIETLSTIRHSRRSQDHSRIDLQSNRKSMSDDQVSKGISTHEKRDMAPELTVNKRGSRVMAAVAAFNGKAKQPREEAPKQPEPRSLDPKSIESAFESMLDARNVPQNTKDKMRSLDTNIKADLLKQDKTGSGSASSTEGLAKHSSRPGAGKRSKTEDDVSHGVDQRPPSSANEDPARKSRPRSRTFTFTKGEGSPSKKQKSDRSISHRRSKSGELKASESSKSLVHCDSSSKGWLFAKSQVFTTPDDCISYLRKREAPQVVEVGKIHKLRQLLRNETVEWVNTFITDGGMTEIIDLLYRLLVVEWREEHEDTLLHETLTCLKALSTTSLALHKFTTIHGSLFPALLGLLYSEEKKGPSEFTTRSLIIGLLSAYISTAPAPDITTRARTVLSYLRDPAKPEADQLPGFIASMHHPRPYRVWQKEISDVTKEVFWIFLHTVNVIPYPEYTFKQSEASYLALHYPKPHPPIPTAPYIGGVEWDATTYLTAHLDLVNAIMASLPTMYERNALRQELKDSGFEKVMGGSLRTCKEKFYGSVHEALSTWVGAAVDDDWEVKGVREGALPKTAPNSPRKNASPKKENKDLAPKLDMPKLDLGECIGRQKAKEDFEGWF